MIMVNLKLRFKNRVWLGSFIALCVSFGYQLAEAFGYAPSLDQEQAFQIVDVILMILASVGFFQDPTTEGVRDSDLVMTYNHPRRRDEPVYFSGDES